MLILNDIFCMLFWATNLCHFDNLELASCKLYILPWIVASWEHCLTPEIVFFYNELLQCQNVIRFEKIVVKTWWRYQMETFFTLLALCEGNPLVTGGFPSQRPVTRSFDVCFYLRLNKRLSIQSKRRWRKMPSHSLWRHFKGASRCPVSGYREELINFPIIAHNFGIIYDHCNIN